MPTSRTTIANTLHPEIDAAPVSRSYISRRNSRSLARANAREPSADLHLSTSPGRILVCRPNSRLGNALMLTPLLQELELLFPGAEIDIVSACPAAAEIFAEYGGVRNVHVLPRFGALHPFAMLRRFLRIRQVRYDLIIDPCPKSWSARFWTRAMRSRADKLGFRSHWKSKGVNCNVWAAGAPPHMAQYPVYLIRRVVDRAGGRSHSAVPLLNIRLTKPEREFGAQKVQQLVRDFNPRDPIVALFLNATGEKKFALQLWLRIVECLKRASPGLQIIEIASVDRLRSVPEWPSYFSTSIRRMAAVIDAADAFISADCGVMHLAAATSTPTIGLFKVTDAAKYAPYGIGNVAVQVDEKNPDSAIAEVAQRISTGYSKRTVRHVFTSEFNGAAWAEWSQWNRLRPTSIFRVDAGSFLRGSLVIPDGGRPLVIPDGGQTHRNPNTG